MQRKVVFSSAAAQPNEAPHARYFGVLNKKTPEIRTRSRRGVDSNCRCRIEKAPFVKPRSVDWALAQFGELAVLIRPTSKLSTH
jgi:hypothetical protein